MGEADPFELFMLVSSYRVIATTLPLTGTIYQPDAIELSVDYEELVLDGKLDLSLMQQSKL